MNIGQVLEMHLGYAYRTLSLKSRQQLEAITVDEAYKQVILDAKDKQIADKKEYIKITTPVFDGARDEDLKQAFQLADLPETFKSTVYDGRTGDKFDNPVTVGVLNRNGNIESATPSVTQIKHIFFYGKALSSDEVSSMYQAMANAGELNA
jgi:DNA-directed RNA polymerase beta subunit